MFILTAGGIITIVTIVSFLILLFFPKKADCQTALYDDVPAIAAGSSKNVALAVTNGSLLANDGKTYLYMFNDTATATPDGINIIQITGRSVGRWMRLKTGWETVQGLSDSMATRMRTAAFAGLFTAALTSGAMNTAYGFTPYPNSNPNSYITSASISGKKDVTDSGRNVSQYITGGTLKKVIDSLSAITSYVPTPSVVTRAINSSTWTVSATKQASVCYNLTISCTATIGSAATGSVALMYSTNGGSTYTTVATVSNSNTVTLAITLNSIQISGLQLCGTIPAGAIVKMVPSVAGTSVISYLTGVETY